MAVPVTFLPPRLRSPFVNLFEHDVLTCAWFIVVFYFVVHLTLQQDQFKFEHES